MSLAIHHTEASRDMGDQAIRCRACWNRCLDADIQYGRVVLGRPGKSGQMSVTKSLDYSPDAFRNHVYKPPLHAPAEEGIPRARAVRVR